MMKGNYVFKKVLNIAAVLLMGTVGAVTVSSPASANPSPALGYYSADFQAQVVEVQSMDNLNQTDKIVQVMHLSPFAMRSLSQCSSYTYCMWTSTSFGGSIYAWNTAWNGTCVPVGGSMNNNAESFANFMPHIAHFGTVGEGWWAELFSDGACSVNGGSMEGLRASTSDSNLSPWNNILSSFRTTYCSGSGC